jgi:hypothetical protein
MSTRIHRSLNLFLLAASSVVFGMSGAPAQADDNWTVTGGDWYATGVEEPHPVPPVGSTLRTGQRISTARGQGIELSIGKNRIALDPNTVVIVAMTIPRRRSAPSNSSRERSTSPSEKANSSRSMRPASRQPARAPISRSPRPTRIPRSS